jgi:LysR family transcriptional activator of nhaA
MPNAVMDGATLARAGGQDYDIFSIWIIVKGNMAANWLNYHHLQYFWAVAREGSIVRAAEELGVSQPTISLQLQELERACKCSLFRREGRKLVLTEQGRMAYRYADEIYALGRELSERVRENPKEARPRLVVGVADSVTKIGTGRILEPAFCARAHVIVREDKAERLLPELASGRLDMVISDMPAGTGTRVRVFNHYMGECKLKLFAQHDLAKQLVGSFPKSLNGFPMILPGENTQQRRQLDNWLKKHKVRPDVVAEVEDTAMLVALGYAGKGVYPSSSLVEDALRRLFASEVLGVADGVIEKFYVITAGHEITEPVIKDVWEHARRVVFAAGWKAEARRNKAPQKGE